jgi:class 3 adenylate cyclase/tetratricopeptide (TPR) repeat protein
MIKCPGCGEENPPKFKLCGYCGTPLHAAAPPTLPAKEIRKTVTLLFTDLKDSTALGERLDSEALHEVKERYFNAMAAEIKRHGGKIEKYIGDAIMAVFGLPRAHEDDALRAVRAAVGMKEALEKVNAELGKRFGVELANRTGVNTGEVVASDDPTADQKLATGDAVNVTARLESAAPANEIYIGETTYRLVRDAVDVEAVEPLTLKGKSQPVPAFRLVRAHGQDGNVRRHRAPVVGREVELAALLSAWEAAIAQRRAQLVTVVGDAGVGKTRLVREVIDRMGPDARVVAGRCLPYGDGITFWPLREMVVSAAGIGQNDTPEAAREKLLACVRDTDVADRLASAAGLGATQFPLHEINWAARKFMQTLAEDGPVLAMFDDIHWAEPAFLDLIENLLDTVEDAQVLMMATARHDLIEEKPEWGQRERASRLVLQPLGAAAVAQVVANLLGSTGLGDDLIGRIVAAAEGNPLYVEQMLSMLVDSGALKQEEDGGWVIAKPEAEIAVPPTIQALMEARLDQLDRSERAAAEPASVIGLEFAQPAVQSLAPPAVRESIDKQLAALSRKHFIRPSRSGAAEQIYRFHHHLVREAVYNGLLKRARATMHTEFVKWADRVNAESDRGQEFEAILGYHLEQAYKYLSELGPIDEAGAAIGGDGSRRLANAGRRAFGRGDLHAAANLFRRAVFLLPADDPARAALLPELGEVLIELGNFGESRTVLEEAEAVAERISDQRIAASARLFRMRVRLFSGEPGDWGEATLRMAEESIPLFERELAHHELARAWRLIGLVHGIAARYAQSTEAVTRSTVHARLAGDTRLIARNATGLSSSTLLGPTPVPEAIAHCEQMITDRLGDRQAESKILCTLAQLRAMNGEFAVARALYRRGRGLLRELGQGVNAASTAIDLLAVELLAGDLENAEREVKPDYEFLMGAGETYFLSTIAALLSRVVRDQGRDDEAMVFSRTAEDMSAADDIDSQALWRSIRAPIIARAGKLAEAEALARSAVEFSQLSDAAQMQADSFSELAVVLKLAGRQAEARQMIQKAISIYQAKGDQVSTARSKSWASGLS